MSKAENLLIWFLLAVFGLSGVIYSVRIQSCQDRIAAMERTAHERGRIDISTFVDQLLNHSRRIDALEKKESDVPRHPAPPILWWPGPTPTTNYHYESYATNGIIYCRSDLITNYCHVINWTNVVQVEGGGK